MVGSDRVAEIEQDSCVGDTLGRRWDKGLGEERGGGRRGGGEERGGGRRGGREERGERAGREMEEVEGGGKKEKERRVRGR